jgi:hypothetical protein
MEENSEMIWKIWKKDKSNSDTKFEHYGWRSGGSGGGGGDRRRRRRRRRRGRERGWGGLFECNDD